MVVPVSVSARITEPPYDNIFDSPGLILMVNTERIRDITAWRVDSLFHHALMHVQTPLPVQSNLHDPFGDAFNFDIHLQCRYCRGNLLLEVHIACVVFSRQNVRQKTTKLSLSLSPDPLRYLQRRL